MEKIAFKGDGTDETGRKIIETLEKMGGININRLKGPADHSLINAYFIDVTGSIRWIDPPSNYRILTIEQYEAEQAQKEPIDLTKILEGCEGMELWCTNMGNVTFTGFNACQNRPVEISSKHGRRFAKLTKAGQWFDYFEESECVLFPSKDNRDWSTFKRPANVIFTNCVGEVFTQEDKNNDVPVWWLYLDKICSAGMQNMRGFSQSPGPLTSDIFKTKKSLLLWMAEQEAK